jgi:outer membrane receptor protein involved in Fe transport
MSRKLVLTSLFVLVWAGVAFGQAVSGAINGYLTDPSDAPIVGAQVIVTNDDTGVQSPTTTNDAGFYNATNLTPGQYSITVEKAGFAKFRQEHIPVRVDAIVRIDVHLSLGATSQSIEVVAGAELLQAEKSDVSETFNELQVRDLPTIGRNVTQLYLTVPGALPDSFQMGAGENPSGGERTYVNGTWSGSQEFVLDGITDRSYGFSGIQLIVPPVDSVQELKVTTSSYDPEFGSTSGMVAQYVTKSGSNSLHGTVFYYNRNSATFAADPLTQKIAGTGPEGKGTGVAPFNWNQGGFSLGGPIKKNTLFIFGDYQLDRTVQGASVIATVPNAAFRSGDFSALAATNPIYDPLTGTATDSGRQQISCGGRLNVICPSRINPVATNLLALMPLPNINGGTDNNFVGDIKERLNQNWTDYRGDYNLTDHDKLFGRYSYFSTFLDSPPLFGEAAGGPAQGGLSPEKADSSAHHAALNYSHLFSNTLLAEFRAGYTRFRLSALQYDSNLETNTKVGIPDINTGDPLTGGLAGINIGGPVGSWYMGIPSGVGIPRFDVENTFEYVSNWSQMIGPHQMRWGADFRRYQFDFQSVNASSRGNYSFCQSATGTPGNDNSGLGMATFLLGGTCSFDRAIFTGMPAERQSQFGLYFQDTWRVNARLTLNLGLRWDYFTAVTSPYKGGLANYDPATNNILLAGLGKVSSSTNVSTPLNDFAPRLGAAYKLTQTTVVRAGFGRSFFSSGYDATFYHLTSGYPIVTQQSAQQTDIYQTLFPLNSAPPTAPAPVLPSNGLLPAPDGVTLKSRESDWKTETMDSWNFTVQQALGKSSTLSVAYVGNKGTHLSWGPNSNAANVGVGPLLDRRPYYELYGLSQSISLECNCSDSNYNALQTVFNSQVSRSYSVNSDLTWGKAMGYGANWSSNTYNRANDYGPGGNTIGSGSMDRKFVWITTHTYTLPYGPGQMFGKDATGWKKAVFADWVFSGITAIESGLSYTPYVSSNASLNADFQQRPDLVKGVSPNQVPDGRSAAMWYNPAAFSIPTCCRFGYASVGSLRGPNLVNADWALAKAFTFPTILNREATRVEIRIEGFNAWNSTNLGSPNAAVDSSSAGRITALQAPMRRLEFGAHISF